MKLKIIALLLLSVAILSAQQKKVAPDFTLNTIDGKEIKLSDYRGKVVIIDFWATWCPPCRKEIPGFVELKNKYDKQIEIIGISVDRNAEQVKSFYKSNKMNYPVAMATQDVVKAYDAITKLQYIPTTFIVDKDGSLYDVKVGFASKEEFEKIIKTLISDGKKN